MCRLFELRDKNKAYYGRLKWFIAAKESGIPQLQIFAELKEKATDRISSSCYSSY